MILGVVWHYWIAVAIVVPAILLVIGTVIGYLYKVKMPQYPKK